MNTRILIMIVSFVCVVSACQAKTEPAPVTETADGRSTTQPAQECVLTPPAEPAICTMDWNPVCGCDGKTYSNACVARGAGVPHMEPGECEKKNLR